VESIEISRRPLDRRKHSNNAHMSAIVAPSGKQTQSKAGRGGAKGGRQKMYLTIDDMVAVLLPVLQVAQ
jgi:hypothetical protein